MVHISRFQPSPIKTERVHLVCPDVPLFWGGFYGIFKLSGGMWEKRWFANDRGKTIKKAFAKIRVESAHKINWTRFVC